MNELYQKYINIRRQVTDLDNILAVLSWDQEVEMPVDGADFRAQQIATLSGMQHEISTSKEYVDVLEKLRKDESLDFKQKRNIEESWRVLSKSRKLSREFKERESRTTSEAYQAWIKA